MISNPLVFFQQMDRSTVHEDDIDDMESGNGPSLPLSPRSVEAVEPRPNSAAAASKRDLALKGSSLHCIDIEFSLCGGLDEPSTFTRALFESGKLSYDDFAARMKIHKDHNLFANPNLVVRIGDQYFRWDAACPVIMSRVLYGRSLPSELVDVIKAAVTVPSVCTTPNNEPSTTSPHQTDEIAPSTQNEVTVRPATAPVDSPPTEPETSKR